ncbi:hypothetical protein DSM112329_02915 [Paraconexibacter sp. AEG42_29]|uniref:Uncharacterized protein n=1 Tax=Paraconexibacter sp. AEG42_29 TaxID=2997339 RepID=A0AAU7AWN0_9ACTN
MAGANTMREARAATHTAAAGLAAFIALAAVSLLSAASAHSSCTNAPPPVMRPVAGTPRADLCGVIDSGRYLLLPVIAPLVVFGVTLLVTRSRRVAMLAWALCAGVSVAIALAAGTLEHAVTV